MSKLNEIKPLISVGNASRAVIIPKYWLQIMGINDKDEVKLDLSFNVERKTITIKKL